MRLSRFAAARPAAVLSVLLGLAVIWLPGDAGACDDPIFAVARQKWFLEPHTLLFAYQPGLGDGKALDDAVKQEWMHDEVNLYPTPLDMSKPVRMAQDREFLWELGIVGYPMIVLLDDKGAVLARFGTLAEARKRLAPPTTQDEIVSYGEQRIELKSPAARIVIIHDSKASVTIEKPAATQPVDAGNVTETSSARASRWCDEIAATPLAGLSRADAADIRQPGGDTALIQALKLRPLPVCVLSNPDGEAIQITDKPPTADDLKKIVLSPMRDKILGLLLGNEQDIAMVLVVVYGDDTQANVDALAAVNEAAGQAAQLFKVRVPVLEMDPADPREEFFVKQLGRQPKQAQPIIAPIIGRGKMMQPLVGPITADDVISGIQLAFHQCGCDTDPRQVGQDLLIAVGGGPWTEYDSPMSAAVRKGLKKGPSAAQISRDSAIANLTLDVRRWMMFGAIGLGMLVLLGVLGLWLKSRSLANRD